MKGKYLVNMLETQKQIFTISKQERTPSTEEAHGKHNPENGNIETADFETAISEATYGKFHLLLNVLSIPSYAAAVFETAVISYILPAAQCDLELSLDNKGMLNAITYFGMIVSAFFWGYLADTLGRKKLLVYGHLLDAAFSFLCGFSQNYSMLLAAKFMTGVVITGPCAIVITYLSEFHSTKYRPRVPLAMGIINSFSGVTLPLLAWLILPKYINLSMFNGQFSLHSWQIFILACSIPSLLAGLLFLMLPESPKFLMTTGRNEEALSIFQRIYSFNTGKAPDTYPVKSLIDEIKLHENDQHTHGGHVTANRSKMQALKEGWQQITPLFFPPHIMLFLLVNIIHFGQLMGSNTVRLWLPQIFATINDYNIAHPDATDTSLCTMLSDVDAIHIKNGTTCAISALNGSVYMNNVFVGLVLITGYFIAGFLMKALGKKKLLIILGSMGGSCGILLYFAQNEVTVVALSSLYLTSASISLATMVSVVIDLFPTSLRTMTVSLTLMIGRTGTILGNLIFPILLSTGCLPPFLLVGCVMLVCALLVITLPNIDMKDLE